MRCDAMCCGLHVCIYALVCVTGRTMIYMTLHANKSTKNCIFNYAYAHTIQTNALIHTRIHTVTHTRIRIPFQLFQTNFLITPLCLTSTLSIISNLMSTSTILNCTQRNKLYLAFNFDETVYITHIGLNSHYYFYLHFHFYFSVYSFKCHFLSVFLFTILHLL